MDTAALLERTSRHATAFLDSLDTRPVGVTASLDALRAALARPLPEEPMPDERVIDELVRDASHGILGSAGGRFFGWVIGGTLPAALAADWLTSAWDQNGASNLTAPAEAVVEEICGAWLKSLLGLPEAASFAITTGCQMAHTAAFAAARHRLLADRGWDVEAKGLSGAPPLRIVTTATHHESVNRAARLLGIGADAVLSLPGDDAGCMDPAALERALAAAPGRPTVVSLQAGDLNTGAFDPFGPCCRIARAHRAWVHVDGAFGLWAATSPRYRALLDGVAEAQSWATDGHKWLNLPFDSGFVFVADPLAHRNAFAQETSYSVPTASLRNQKDWNPEWSRRGRGFVAYAAIRALGRRGIGEIVERCSAHTTRLVEGIGGLEGAEIVARPIVNQGLVRFLGADGDHDRRTDAVIRRIQAGGEAWFGGAAWRGLRVMRISVCNWRTSDRDVERAIAAVRLALGEAR